MKLVYYLPNQSEMFSDPQVFSTDDSKKLDEAIAIAVDKGYKIVKVER